MTVTVSQLNKYLFYRFKEDEKLRRITVSGEISNFTRNQRSGHCYFTLKDAESSIRAVMFAGNAAKLEFAPAAGMSVEAAGDVTVYERDGAYQLLVTSMCRQGAGTLSAAFEQLRDRLEEEGLFAAEHKRPLPVMPSRIGVVTSPTGAAIRDIVNILSRRYPLCELAVFPATVQGSEAPVSICSALEAAASADCDVIIVGRGGGSVEDLSCFNSEDVVRAVYACSVPVISAVGHETDFTLCDFAADLRAPTPSAAAELAAPDISQLKENAASIRARLDDACAALLDKKMSRLSAVCTRLDYLSPIQRTQRMEEHLAQLSRRLTQSAEAYISIAGSRLSSNAALLESLSPLKVFSRGYSAVYSGGRLITSTKMVSGGDRLDIRLSDGKIYSTVDFVEKI